MKDDAKLRTVSNLSNLWDGLPIKRVRGGDGTTVLPDRRLAMHLMVQPNVASIWLNDPLLLQQGILSRFLVTAPDAASGTRVWHEPLPEFDAAMKRYGARLLDILERPLPVVGNTRNELAPRTLPLSPDARQVWIAFYDYVEARVGSGGELEAIRGLANKLPEHAARLAAVLTLVRNIEANNIAAVEMKSGIALAEHYAAEALRLFDASQVNSDLRLAQRLLGCCINGRNPRSRFPTFISGA